MPNVLIAGLSSDGNVSMSYANTMIQVTTKLMSTPDVKMYYDIVPSLNDALLLFSSKSEFEYLVAVDTSYNVDPDFLLQFDPAKDFVVAPTPKPEIHWDRVRQKIVDTYENPPLTGVEYDVDLSKVRDMDNSCRFGIVATAGLRILKISRVVLTKLLAHSPPQLLHAPGMIDDVPKTADERVCSLWNGAIHVALSQKTSVLATMAHGPGCVAWRKGNVLR